MAYPYLENVLFDGEDALTPFMTDEQHAQEARLDALDKRYKEREQLIDNQLQRVDVLIVKMEEELAYLATKMEAMHGFLEAQDD